MGVEMSFAEGFAGVPRRLRMRSRATEGEVKSKESASCDLWRCNPHRTSEECVIWWWLKPLSVTKSFSPLSYRSRGPEGELEKAHADNSAV